MIDSTNETATCEGATVDGVAVSIISVLHRCRFDLSCEKRLQEGIELALRSAGIGFTREHRLSDRDIPDFMVDGVVIECKLKGHFSKMNVFRQLSRYAAHDDVRGIILASNIAMGLPTEINGKPTYSASISRGWL